jgi:hypothetical protein
VQEWEALGPKVTATSALRKLAPASEAKSACPATGAESR